MTQDEELTPTEVFAFSRGPLLDDAVLQRVLDTTDRLPLTTGLLERAGLSESDALSIRNVFRADIPRLVGEIFRQRAVYQKERDSLQKRVAALEDATARLMESNPFSIYTGGGDDVCIDCGNSVYQGHYGGCAWRDISELLTPTEVSQ